MESFWPMGLRLGLVAPYQLNAGAFVGMKTFNFIFVLTLTAFIFTVVPASVRL
jgi:hypothetical protein